MKSINKEIVTDQTGSKEERDRQRGRGRDR